MLSFIRTNGRRVFRTLLTSGGPATVPRRITWDTRAGQISMLFIAGIIYCILIAPFHHNDGCILRTDCPLCKFAIDFSSCDKTDSQTLVVPEFTSAFFVPEVQICIFGICPANFDYSRPSDVPSKHRLINECRCKVSQMHTGGLGEALHRYIQ